MSKKKENNYNIHNFIQNYVKNINEIEYKKCQAHGQEGQELTSFCPECSIDLCSECINTKQHYHHSIKNYSLDQNKINEIKKCIDEYEKKGEEEQSKNDDDEACIKIFKIIINYDSKKEIYIPCRNFIKTIENIYDYLEKFSNKIYNKDKDNIENANQNLSSIEINYNYIIDLEENKDSIDNIDNINISEQNFYDLKIFEGKHFKKLKKLKLEENNINTIDSLMKADRFESLTELILARNKINDDEVFKHIEKFNYQFPKLEFLSFFCNYLTDYNIFKKISELKELKRIHLGSNRFEKNKIEEDIYFLHLEELGVSCGVFNDKTIKYLSHFKFENLKKLYLQGNNLSCLDFLGTINYKDIEVIRLYNNNLYEYKSIINYGFKELKKLNLEGNKIANIDDLIDFIEKNKKIEVLDLSNNLINLSYSQIKEIKEKVKNINKNLSLIL